MNKGNLGGKVLCVSKSMKGMYDLYEYIIGKYVGISKDYIIVENNNIGYKIYTSGSTMSNLPRINENIKIYTIQIVREDFIGLYGFITKEELNMFNMLLSVSGVGPKSALSLLSIGNVKSLKNAIINEDEKLIAKAPGIGKKTARRIILEIKDKIDIDNLEIGGAIDSSNNEKIMNEAREALISLGYKENEIRKVLKKVDCNDSIENIIKNSLKNLMK